MLIAGLRRSPPEGRLLEDLSNALRAYIQKDRPALSEPQRGRDGSGRRPCARTARRPCARMGRCRVQGTARCPGPDSDSRRLLRYPRLRECERDIHVRQVHPLSVVEGVAQPAGRRMGEEVPVYGPVR